MCYKKPEEPACIDLTLTNAWRSFQNIDLTLSNAWWSFQNTSGLETGQPIHFHLITSAVNLFKIANYLLISLTLQIFQTFLEQ